jgi:hypothetical protein
VKKAPKIDENRPFFGAKIAKIEKNSVQFFP